MKGLRIGLPQEYFTDGIDPDVRKCIDDAIAHLENLGAEMIKVSLPHTEYAIATYYIIATAEASANLARFDGVRYGNRANEPDDILDHYRRSRAAGFGDEVKRRIMLGNYVLSSGYYDAYYLHAQKVRKRIIEDFNKSFEKVDLILTPTTPSDAFVIGDKNDDPIAMYLNDIFTVPSSLAGLPAISIPAGMSSNQKPLGLQLISNSFCEDLLLQGAYKMEESLNFKFKPNLQI